MHPLTLSAIAALAFIAAAAHADEVTHVGMENGELVYSGDVTDDANQRLFALYDSLATKPTVLRIQSTGGVVEQGLDLGSWLHANKLDVKVTGYCLSSCANYVFTAGQRKIVGNGALIGFHGGISSAHFALDDASQAAYDAMTREQQAVFWASVKSGQQPTLEREQAFFDMIGVRQDITTYGQAARFKQDLKGVVWTYSEAGFKRLGVSGIQVIDGPWRPSTHGGSLDFTLLEVD